MTADGELALTVYAKRTTGSRYLNLTIATAISGGSALATFDLAGGATHTSNGASSTLTNLSATQTASGNGYYKCVFKATGSGVTGAHISLSNVATPAAGSFGLVYYTGDGTSSIDVAFASLSTTGATDYNATTTSIHRQYAPSLKSVATAGQPRFEYDPSTDGQSMGILIEGQSTNAIGYSESLASWDSERLTAANASAVGPTGNLNAALLTPSTDVDLTHDISTASVTTSVTGTVTLSGYFKAAGYDYVTLGIGNRSPGNFSQALFSLSTGAYITNSSGGSNSYISSSTEHVGNGWWRLVATFSTSRSNEKLVIAPAPSASPSFSSFWGTPTYTGDGYSSVLATGIQAEIGKSFASSLITSNSGAETTRAAESLSVGR
ncbi:MAG: hypothetical protein EBT12_06410 [Marivivens sp.]|nr:hypothetical protein [Marivivens sp.]